jgi:hypothetical protein
MRIPSGPNDEKSRSAFGFRAARSDRRGQRARSSNAPHGSVIDDNEFIGLCPPVTVASIFVLGK